MDQKELRLWESRCIQEEPPYCKAACPIHVDARAFCAAMSKGDTSGARKILEKTMPLAGVTARLCEAPCEKACIREQRGGAVAVGLLERTCISLESPVQKVLPLPKRGTSAAIFGDGPAGLTAASDLARKGHSVTVFHFGEAPGDSLREFGSYDETTLPKEVLATEIRLLEKLGVTFFSAADQNPADAIDAARSEFKSVFLDASAGTTFDFPELNPTDPKTLGCALEGVFHGGFGADTYIDAAAAGRRGAGSLDRYMRGVSLTAERHGEGPQETGLFTNIDAVSDAPPIEPSGRLFSEEEAKAEAARCIQCECMECVRACAFLEKYGAYPKTYARRIYNNEAIVKGTHQANEMINSCSLCGQCEVICPNDFSMAELCLNARRTMVTEDRMPPSAQHFALAEMRSALDERSFLARHAPDSDSSRYLFFPGCQLSGTRPTQVRAVYAHLNETLPGGTALMLACCGAPAQWGGQDAVFTEVLDRIRAQWDSLGCPQVISACSSCLAMFTEYLPELRAVSLWETLIEHGLPESRVRRTPVAVSDPCTTRHAPEVRGAVRAILETIGQRTEELQASGQTTECCGFGGLMESANPELAREVIQRRAAQSDADFLAYCAMCRDRLASTGKRTVHLLDLLFPEKACEDAARITVSAPCCPGLSPMSAPGESGTGKRVEDCDDPADLPPLTISDRQENRAALKSDLESGLWDIGQTAGEDWESITLRISPQMTGLMERRRILRDDVRRVILAAEADGCGFVHETTGSRLYGARLGEVTFWVEYTPEEDGFRVLNLWSHRMKIEREEFR